MQNNECWKLCKSFYIDSISILLGTPLKNKIFCHHKMSVQIYRPDSDSFYKCQGKIRHLSWFLQHHLQSDIFNLQSPKNFSEKCEEPCRANLSLFWLVFRAFSRSFQTQATHHQVLGCKSVIKWKQKCVTFPFEHKRKIFRKISAAKTAAASQLGSGWPQSIHCFTTLLNDQKHEMFM